MVYALHLAQLEVLHEDENRHAIVLCDELASELDQANVSRVLGLLASKPTQVFIAGTDVLERAVNFELTGGGLARIG